MTKGIAGCTLEIVPLFGYNGYHMRDMYLSSFIPREQVCATIQSSSY